MCDRQISVRRVAYELALPTSTVYEIMSDYLGMKKVSTRWVSNLLKPIQRANRVDCCQELLKESEVNPDNYLDRIVTGDETCLYFYGPFSQQEAKIWKKPSEETPTRLRRTRSAEKIMMILSGTNMIFCWPNTCYVEPRSTVLIIHQSSSGCGVPFWRNIVVKLVMECCFFMTIPSFTSAILFRLLFERLASLN